MGIDWLNDFKRGRFLGSSKALHRLVECSYETKMFVCDLKLDITIKRQNTVGKNEHEFIKHDKSQACVYENTLCTTK